LTAARIAGQNNAKLCILHVLESASFDNRHFIKHFKTGEEIFTNIEYERAVVKELKKNYGKMLSGYNYEIRITSGFPWEEILGWSQQEDTDLIILGPHSNRAEEKGVVRVAGKVGSTADSVISRSICPVMIVNPKVEPEKLNFKKVLIGVDFSSSCECALCCAVKMAQKYDTDLSAFHMLPVAPSPKFSREDWEAKIDHSKEKLKDFCHGFLDGTNHEYNIWGGALPHIELLKCAEKIKADLIVMGSHTQETSEKWYAGSAVERVSFRALCPVIIVTDPDMLFKWEAGGSIK
ncbi:universal stress protein, partial [Desulfobacterales bacterium HSG16]|nr:universal stress protein [Desulfobacterales bacterium HSG16]